MSDVNPVPIVNKSSASDFDQKPDFKIEEEKDFKKLSRIAWYMAGIFAIAGLTVAIFFWVNFNKGKKPSASPSASVSSLDILEKLKMVKSVSDEEFKNYLAQAQETGSAMFGSDVGLRTMDTEGQVGLEAAPQEIGAGGGALPERVSETNVQVKGIDEPDIVKTNGKQIFYSQQFRFYVRPAPMPEPINIDMMEERVDSKSIAPRPSDQETKVLTAFPPADLAQIGSLDKTGELLLSGKMLLVIPANRSQGQVFGFDVSEPSQPSQKWSMELKNQSYIVSARLYQDKLYLVTNTWVSRNNPCPIVPFMSNGAEIKIRCTDIYHPQTVVSADTTFTAFKINISTGKIENQVSFLGSNALSIIYMSKNALYSTYSFSQDMVKFFTGFYEQNPDLISESGLERLKKLKDYDLSQQAKVIEMQTIIEEYQRSLSDDERLRIENETENKMEAYVKQHKRDLQQTGIVKIGLLDFDIKATGQVPGSLLNQFSLDEYQDNLRLATTVGQTFGRSQSANDIYILDANLNKLAEITDLGLEERIYSARFIEDKGYLVTFRQIDPFYVLDLADPKDPKVSGELKIPGYSSYLHPIDKDRILGIGKEDSNVKISLFDVSDPANPLELDKYIMQEYWSDILNTHHAFLLDSKHQVFFMPGSQGGYVFSYGDNKLSLLKAVANINSQRALYLDDYLYILGTDKVVVLNEIDWQEINSLLF
jgi:inhibitor of cysteine peptidase